MDVSSSRVFAAEVVGTAVLMMGGLGAAVLAPADVGSLGVALAFGFAFVVMAYAIGHVSGCHINPAITLGMVLTRKLTIARAVYYWVAQLLGAAIGALVIFAIARNIEGFTNNSDFAQNGFDAHSPGGYGLVAVLFAEVMFTAVLVYVVLSSTNRRFPVGFAGLATGLTYGLIHLVLIPVDNTSVNPARSFGSALFAGWDALGQLWVFIVFPLLGSAVGALVWLVVDEARLEDTLFAEVPGAETIRDAADRLDDHVDDPVDDQVATPAPPPPVKLAGDPRDDLDKGGG
jgi:aquaporin Z